jgi:hypothetical protein
MDSKRWQMPASEIAGEEARVAALADSLEEADSI